MIRLVTLGLFASLWTAPAMAQDRGARADDAAFAGDDDGAYVPAPKDRLWYSNAAFVRANPLGLVNIHRLGWRHRLSTKDSLLFRDTYTFLGAGAIVTPAWTRLGAYGEAQVLALVRVFGGPFYEALRTKLGWRGRPDYRVEPENETGS